MSVINRMLLELDERHDSTAQQRLPGMVRAVPARFSTAPVRPWLWIALIIAVILLLTFFIWRAIPPAILPIPPTVTAQPASVPLTTTPQPLQLQSATSLDQARILTAADDIQPRAVIPTPIPGPAPTSISPNNSKPTKTISTFLLPARADATENGDKVEPGIKTSPSTENTTLSMKHVSKEQQADFRYREALAFVSQNRSQDAQTALEEALRLDPRHLAARQALLSLFLKAKRYPSAEQTLQDGLKLNLAVASLASTLASVQLEQGDATAALTTLEKYAAQASGHADYHGFYAALLQRIGRHAEAIGQFQAALKAQPNRGNWLMGLGISLQAEKHYADAEQAYLRARASNSLSPDLLAFIEQRLQQLRQVH